MGDQPARLKADFTKVRSIPANWCNLRHTNEEFVFDFGMTAVEPEVLPPIADTSVVLSYFMAKRFYTSLGIMIKNWEDNYGEIETDAANRLVAREPQPLQPLQPMETRSLTKIRPPVSGRPPQPGPPSDDCFPNGMAFGKPHVAAGTTVDVMAKPLDECPNSPPINPVGMPDQD